MDGNTDSDAPLGVQCHFDFPKFCDLNMGSQISNTLGRPKISTFFRINALFWPTYLPIPQKIHAK